MVEVVRQQGLDLLRDTFEVMLNKEQVAQVRAAMRNCPKDSPDGYVEVDYLSVNFGNQITAEMREEAVLSILQFAVQTQCLDQTVLQAVHLADNYLRCNRSCQSAFVKVIYAVALEISIKLNEQKFLSLADLEALFDDQFTTKMLSKLESHILSLCHFRVNVATPLDFMLHLLFLFDADVFAPATASDESLRTEIANSSLPYIYFAMSQYDLSRKRSSSIAIAAICAVMRDLQITQCQS